MSAQIHDADYLLEDGPFSPDAPHLRRKGAALEQYNGGQTWIHCTVGSVYPETHTCAVYTKFGNYLPKCGWPGAPSEISPPIIGGSYLVNQSTSPPTLQVAPPMVGLPTGPTTNVSELPGVASSVRGAQTHNQPNFAGSAPRDVVPGDWIRQSPTGNYVGALKGGVSTLHGGEYAQVQAISNQETGDEIVDLVGTVIRMFSGAGKLQFLTDERRDKNGKVLKGTGKSSMVFSIGADAETESSPEEEHFRVRAELGQEGNLARVAITDSKGRPSYSIQIYPTGDTQVTQRSEVRRIDLGYKLVADSFFIKAKQNGVVDADGDLNINSGGSFKARSYGRLNLTSVGGSASLQSAQHLSLKSGNTMSVTANGPLIPLPLFIPPLARSIDVVASNGSVVFDIGTPAPLGSDFGLALSGFRVGVNSAGGAIRFSTSPAGGGGFIVDTTTPGSVKLGGPSLAPEPAPLDPGLFSAVLYEPLIALLEKMSANYDLHTHTVVEGSPSTGPPIPLNPVTGPYQFSDVTAAALVMISKFVRFGG